MKIQYITGDLLKSGERIIAHGCNAQGVMKSGVAKLIREYYPEAYHTYKFHYDHDGLELGDVIRVHCNNGNIVLNLITQEFYGREDVRYVSYDAVAKAITNINKYGYTRVAFPKIGAGLANGNWKVIEAIIEAYSEFTPIVYQLD